MYIVIGDAMKQIEYNTIDMKNAGANKICNASLPISGYCEDWNCRYWCSYQFPKVYKTAWCLGPDGTKDCYCYFTC